MAGARARLVLIVEDDRTTGDVLASAINDQRGYRALTVATGDDALDALGRIDGSLPIVFETGTGREHAAELRARGVATYIKKPFDLDELVRFVRRLVPPRNGAKHPG